jgi:hypothetical protein
MFLCAICGALSFYQIKAKRRLRLCVFIKADEAIQLAALDQDLTAQALDHKPLGGNSPVEGA